MAKPKFLYEVNEDIQNFLIKNIWGGHRFGYWNQHSFYDWHPKFSLAKFIYFPSILPYGLLTIKHI